jgi:uncharacterized membrane protein
MMEKSAEQHEEVIEAVQENLEKVERFAEREEQKTTSLQRSIERVSYFFGHPYYFAAFVLFCVIWILLDLVINHYRHFYFDEPPFFWLQGIVAFNGVLITMAVLIRQNRLAQIEEKRAHLELQVNLLAEQKATKIIQLLEELRADLPNVKNRQDPDARILQESPDPEAILNALEKHSPIHNTHER